MGTNPTSTDTDNDGMTDSWEVFYGLNPIDPTDASLDSDSDGLSNLREYLWGSDPRNPYSPLLYPFGAYTLIFAFIISLIILAIIRRRSFKAIA